MMLKPMNLYNIPLVNIYTVCYNVVVTKNRERVNVIHLSPLKTLKKRRKENE